MILIVSKPKHHAKSISDMFNFMGVLSTAVTPIEAFAEVSGIYRAVLVVAPERLYDEDDFVRKMRSYAAEIPIFSLGTPRSLLAFNQSFPENLSAAKIFSAICCYTESNSMKIPGRYMIAGVNASVSLSTPMYFSAPLPLTKTELMIVRTLSRFYPTPIKAAKILKYSFRYSRTPEETSVRTHISIINKKFRKISGRNLILNYEGKGYIILTPEISEHLENTAI